jgi:TetR/AcrR family transcriptional regulator of autoinduction and epiphytic fitness
MPEEVKARTYDNSRREAAARLTRRAVVDAARELFFEFGYPTTTLRAIAEHASVSVQTVYAQFGNKRAVLKAVIDQTVAGDDEPVAVSARTWVERVREESDPRRKVQLHAEGVVTILGRTAELDRMVRSAAAVDRDAAELWRVGADQRRRGMREFVEHLKTAELLRPDLSIDDAARRIATLIDPELYRMTVVDGGWSPEQHRDWLVELVTASVLSPGSRGDVA